jgi:phthalate 4,5-dioxygenase oxygenase subunit
MLSAEDNELLTRTGPGTPGGELLRRYWQPVALGTELPAGAPPLAVRILSEDLTLFRDDQGRIGLLGIHCSHRAADLSYGRVEDGGLRCLYHGWLYDVAGNCLEQPGEPEGSVFKDKVKQLAYPCREAGGLIFTYMGPGEPPLLPNYEFMGAPDENLYASKVYCASNYLQGNEGNIDPSHLSYLHKFFSDAERARTVVGGASTSNTYFGNVVCPTIELEETDFGLRIFTIRDAEDGKQYVRVTNFVYPNWAPNPQGVDGYNVNWHVPIDDRSSWKIRVGFKRGGFTDKAELAKDFFKDVDQASWVPFRNIDNRYEQDRQEMEDKSFIGMGRFFPVHDLFATETQGPIQDRTKEHLGYTDKAIAAHRRLLLQAVRTVMEGGEAPHVIRDPAKNNMEDLVCADAVIPAGEDWRTTWREHLVVPVTA